MFIFFIWLTQYKGLGYLITHSRWQFKLVLQYCLCCEMTHAESLSAFRLLFSLPTPILASSRQLQGEKKQFVIVHLKLSKQAIKQVKGDWWWCMWIRIMDECTHAWPWIHFLAKASPHCGLIRSDSLHVWWPAERPIYSDWLDTTQGTAC